MKLSIEILNHEEYFLLAKKFYSKLEIDKSERRLLKNSTLCNYSISVVTYNKSIPILPCIEINIRIIEEEKIIGNYLLYINFKNDFIDEYLIIN